MRICMNAQAFEYESVLIVTEISNVNDHRDFSSFAVQTIIGAADFFGPGLVGK